MSDKTGIDWTESTWNPLTGCEHVSPGCDHCYAARQASGRLSHLPAYEGLASNGKFNGTVRLLPERLDQPLRWKRPRMIFVNSMSDLFHKDVPDEYIARVFAVMAIAGQHTFQVLTKRHARMRSLLEGAKVNGFMNSMLETGMRDYGMRGGVEWPLPNVWLGISAENQQWADIRIPALLDTPAAVRFVSAEPLLGPITLPCEVREGHMPTAPDWLIVGGESGPGARPMHPGWARDLRDQCAALGTAFFMKQFGAWRPLRNSEYPPPGETRTLHQRGDARDPILVLEGGHNNDPGRWPADLRVREYPRREVPSVA